MIFNKIFLIILLICSYRILACTIFTASDGKLVLVGNEEDFYDYTAKVQINPGTSSKYGTIYFGFYDNPYIPFGGVNSKGLFFDVSAYPEKPEIIDQFPKDKFTFTYQSGHRLFAKMLEECSTVEEAIVLLEKYNSIAFSWCHLLIADSTGASAVVEWGDGELVIIKSNKSYQVSTNFNFTNTSWGYYPCERFKTASSLLEQNTNISVPLFVDILSKVHKTNAIYSNVYDITNGEIYVFQHHDLENYIKINVQEEIANGYRLISISNLFEEKEVFKIDDLTNIDNSDNETYLASKFSLYQNYPNPFNPTTKISYSLNEESNVKLNIYNTLGSEIITLVNENQKAGFYSINYSAENLTSGFYIYQITIGNKFRDSKKMLYLK